MICVIGGIAGWLASIVVKGTGMGLFGDIIVGIAGANITGWMFPALGINIGDEIIGVIIAATIGAILMLPAIKLIRKA